MSETSDNNLPSIPAIDKLIHEPARLIIMANLFVVESVDYLFLQRQTDLTWGNIASHVKKLEKAGYVSVEKEFVEKNPHYTKAYSTRTKSLQRIQRKHETSV